MLSTISIVKRALTVVLFSSIINILSGQAKEIDTTEYLLPYFEKAVDFNLLIAASKGYDTEIGRLVKKGADVNAETIEGVTPLIYAVANNHAETVRALLNLNAEVNKMTNSFDTPLLIAVKNQNIEIAEMLLRSGADINMTDDHGASPLHYASVYGSFNTTDLLLYYEADIDKKTRDGTSPLMAAIWSGYADVADLLIQNGANMEARDNQGFTPFLIAAQNGDTLLMKLLLKYGVDLYEKNIFNYNALDISIENDHKPAVELLLEKGDKWTTGNSAGINPYRVASSFGRKDYIEMLESKKIEGKAPPAFDEFAINISSKFNTRDIYSSFGISLREPLLNIGIRAGIDTKLWYTRVLKKNSENVYYQYMDKSSIMHVGFFKDFLLNRNTKRTKIFASSSLSLGYLFGNKLKGTNIAPDNKFLIVPYTGIKLQKKNFIFSAGLEYSKTEFYLVGPLWFRAGCSYNFYLSKVRSPGKTIKWN